MTPTELANRLAAMDWSACSLQHQLAVRAAVLFLGGRIALDAAEAADRLAHHEAVSASRAKETCVVAFPGAHEPVKPNAN